MLLACSMHTYLRAWRKHRGLSQATVGDMMGVEHSTIGRWELGTMRLTTTDLMRLADIYKATPSQIIMHPDMKDIIAQFERFQSIVGSMPTETVDDWLKIGERLSGKV